MRSATFTYHGDAHMPDLRPGSTPIPDLSQIGRKNAQREEITAAMQAGKIVAIEQQTWGQRALGAIVQSGINMNNAQIMLANGQVQQAMIYTQIAGTLAQHAEACARLAAANIPAHEPFTDEQYRITTGIAMGIIDPNTWEPIPVVDPDPVTNPINGDTSPIPFRVS